MAIAHILEEKINLFLIQITFFVSSFYLRLKNSLKERPKVFFLATFFIQGEEAQSPILASTINDVVCKNM